MTRAPDGARVVQAALQSFEACRALVESITGRDMADGHDLLLAASSSPPAEGQEDGPLRVRDGHQGQGQGQSQASLGIEGLGLGSLEPQQVDAATQASMARIDRENGLCMVAELVRNHASDLLPLRKNIYEQLLLTGGELVLHARESGRVGAGGTMTDVDMGGGGVQGNIGGGMAMGGYRPDWNTQ